MIQMSLSIPITPNSLSSAKSRSGDPMSARSLSLTTKLSQLSLTIPISKTYKTTPIRMGGLPRPRLGGEARGMGGGPRPYPGGEALLEWKRMQGKKSKEVLKARFDRERRIYKKRKRAEIKAAVSELERPWENLENGLPSPNSSHKGDIRSVKSYRKTDELTNPSEEFESSGEVGKMGLRGIGDGRDAGSNFNGRNLNNLERRSSNGVGNRDLKGKARKNGNSSDLKGKNLGNARFSNKFDARSGRPGDSSREFRRSNSYKKSEVFDLNLDNDGSYGFGLGNTDDAINSGYLGR